MNAATFLLRAAWSDAVEIVEVVPYERLRLRAEDPQGAFDNPFDMRPSGSGTE